MYLYTYIYTYIHIYYTYYIYNHICLSGKSACQCRRCQRIGFNPWVRKIPWRRTWQPNPVLSLGKFLGQKSLAPYSPWGHKESDTTERVHSHTCMHICCMYSVFHWRSQKSNLSQKLKASYIYATKCQFR